MNPVLHALRLSGEAHGDLREIYWDSYDPVGPLILADGTAYSRWSTMVQVVWDATHLYVAFTCADDVITAGHTDRNAPLYEQEVVEVFLAPITLTSYYEINLSPRNILFDSKIQFSGSRHVGDPSWECAELGSAVKWQSTAMQGDWKGFLAIPWRSLEVLTPRRGDRWAANFYRIKRQEGDEFSCWSPTVTDPANFHVPSRFGELLFTD